MLFLPFEVFGHVQILLSGAPLLMEFREKGSNETNGGFFIREHPDDALPASDLFVEPFLGVGTSFGKGQNVDHFVKPFLQAFHGLGRGDLSGRPAHDREYSGENASGIVVSAEMIYVT